MSQHLQNKTNQASRRLMSLEPFYKQHLAYTVLDDDITNFLLYGGGAEGGKSWLGAEWLMRNCYRYPGTKWFIGRNELKRIMTSSYQTFLKVNTKHGINKEDPVYGWKLNGQYNYIQYRNGSRIDLLDLKYLPTDPQFQRFGSTEYTGGWIEEAGEVHFMAFDVLKSRIGRWRNDEYGLNPAKMLLTCNPEQNWLYRIFYKPAKKGTLEEGYQFIQALYKDNPHTREQAEKRLDKIRDPVLRARLKLGMWEYSVGDNSLVTYDEIMDMFTNTLAIDGTEQKYLSADVARHGSDKVVYGNWKGLELYKITAKKDRRVDQTAQDIRQELASDRIPYSHAVIDDDGVGGGVVDLTPGSKGFIGNSSAIKKYNYTQGEIKENFRNLRSQCGFMLAEKIKNHEIAVTARIDESTKEMIIEDLQALLKRKETSVEAPLALIDKDDVKEVIGRSPDFADMMLMRMYFELDRPVHAHQNDDPGGVLPLIPGTLA